MPRLELAGVEGYLGGKQKAPPSVITAAVSYTHCPSPGPRRLSWEG